MKSLSIFIVPKLGIIDYNKAIEKRLYTFIQEYQMCKESILRQTA